VITFVLGGARSGKSVVAERLAARPGAPVTYLSTLDAGDDAELAARVATHRARRPAHWVTVEVGGGLADAVRVAAGTALVDSLGPWVAAAPGMVVDVNDLCKALAGRRGDSVVVSEEVGLGVHPATTAGLAFRDALGSVNQAVAALADEVVLVVAGRVLRLEETE